MLKLILRKKVIIIVGMLLFMLAGVSLKLINQLNYVTMTVSLNYPGVEKGLNPDGTKFDIFEIISDKILNRTLGKFGDANLTMDHIRSRIRIYPVAPKNINEKIRTELVKGKDFSYFPNEYIITYSQKSKFSENHTIRLLEALSESYKEVFKEKNTDKGIILIETKFEQSDFEYIEMSDIFDNKISTIINYLKTKNYENGTFRSNVTNQTFQNLIVELESLKSIEVFNLRAFIYTSAIAKNKPQLIERLMYDINKSEHEYEKFYGETEICKEAMRKYDSSIIEPIYIPSLDNNNDFYMNKTNTGLDYLAKRALESGVKAETIKKDIENLRKFIDVLSNQKLEPEEYKRLIDITEQMIAEIQSKLDNLAKVSQDTVSDYFLYKTKDYLKFNIPKLGIRDFINLGYVKTAVIYALVGLIFMCLIILIFNIKSIKAFNINLKNEEFSHK